MQNNDGLDLKYSQNFLFDRNLVGKIVWDANLDGDKTILEIGPGHGIITSELVEVAGPDGRVVGVELDTKLEDKLKEKFEDIEQLEIIHQNFLEYDLNELGNNYQVFSNVPFSITSEVLDHLFNLEKSPDCAYLILQKESLIDDKAKGETLKSLLIKPWYEIKVGYKFSKSNFQPKPSVDTYLFSFKRREGPMIQQKNYELYRNFISFVSKDRVSEGNWKKLFTKKQLSILTTKGGLENNKGIRSQSFKAMVGAFEIFEKLNKDKFKVLDNSMNSLRDEQSRKNKIDRANNHHRLNRNLQRD